MVSACERVGVPLDRIEDIAAGCVNPAHEGMGDIARWADLADGCAKLVHLMRPRDLDPALGQQLLQLGELMGQSQAALRTFSANMEERNRQALEQVVRAALA